MQASIPLRLAKVVRGFFRDEGPAQDLIAALLGHAGYDRNFAAALIVTARGTEGETWELRRLAVLSLEHQFLQIDSTQTEEFDSLLQCIGLKALHGLARPVNERVLREGFSSTQLREFTAQLCRRLRRFDRIHKQIRGVRTSAAALHDFLYLARQDCKLTLSRCFFSPDEVAERIMLLLQFTAGQPVPPEYAHAADEAELCMAGLPDYEAAIIGRLKAKSGIFWVADSVESRLNSLVEYPLGTVVSVLKFPGSDIEIELKRAGRRRCPVLGVTYERFGKTVPRSHRLDGGSMGTSLQFEAGRAALLANIFRLVHGCEAPIAINVSLTRICRVPAQSGQPHILDYFTDARAFGAGFIEMRKAMQRSVEAFSGENGRASPEFPSDLGLTAQFLGQVVPCQAMLCRTSSFRLDAVANYLSTDGPQRYFKDGLKVAFTKHEARQFADELLYEVLGKYTPPPCSYRDHVQYVAEALAITANRNAADQAFHSAICQVGELWGTLLAVGGYSYGESFVARNVGLRTVWEQGEWKVKLIFMDHDNLHIVDRTDDAFCPYRSMPAVREDESYIIGNSDTDCLAPSTISTLERIYQLDAGVRRDGTIAFHRAMDRAYKKTHQEMAANPAFQQLFSPTFLLRLRQWDDVVHSYLTTVRDALTLRKWKTHWRRILRSQGDSERYLTHYLECVERHSGFLRQYSFLYDRKPTE